jgi:hypothetical protein
VWAATIVVSTGLRDERRTGRPLVLGCGVTGKQCDPGSLRTNFAQARGRRAARQILVCSHLMSKGWERERLVEHVSPRFFPPFSCSSKLAPPVPLRLSRPSPPSSNCIVLTTRKLFSLVSSYPNPWSLAASLFPKQQDHGTGTHPHPHPHRYVRFVTILTQFQFQ